MLLPAPLIAMLLVLQDAPRAFTPALDFRQRTVAEWTAELDRAGGRPVDAAWSLYYHDDRSPEVVDALRTALATPQAAEAHLAIDSVLAHWGVPFEALPIAAFRADGHVQGADALFPLPFEPMGLQTDELLEPLGLGDRALALRAALTLVARGEHVVEALDRLAVACGGSEVPADVQFDWLRNTARRGLGAAIGRQLQRALDRGETDAVEVANWVQRLGGCTGCAPGAAPALVALAELQTPLARPAIELLQEASRPRWHDTLEDWAFHKSYLRQPAGDREFDAALARFYGRRVEACARAGQIETSVLAELAVRIQNHPAIVPAIEPGLLALLERDTPMRIEVLRLLCHAKCKDPRVRSAWLDTARGWTDFSARELNLFPCLAEHDEETRTVLFDVMRKAESIHPFANRLEFAGLTDADRSPLARWFLDHLERESALWSWLPSSGFRGFVDEPLAMPERLTDMKDRALRVNRIALNCAARRARGEDGAAEEAALVAMLELDYPYNGAGGYNDYVQWGFWHAQSLGLHSEPMVRVALRRLHDEFPDGWSTHAEAAQAYLETADLTIAQQVELERAIPYEEPGDRLRGVNIANTRYDGRGAGRVAVERAPLIRRALYGGNAKALDELARCTRLVDRDVDYLLAVLQRAPAEARSWALRLVDEHEIDAPRVRDAVRARTRDMDDEVARRAQALIAARAW